MFSSFFHGHLSFKFLMRSVLHTIFKQCSVELTWQISKYLTFRGIPRDGRSFLTFAPQMISITFRGRIMQRCVNEY